ncbi:competence protein ComK [Tuberibacillus sp. Marseille-P3662]|uniref:competence protein ComK n=1 Tax=Tuberibacillus sp. Marseille-P3662 TaxID=1965358 RepID=UPI000A1CF206|nr:competence protein ComK [Tuberibacillus sp. Marseille-P3662]
MIKTITNYEVNRGTMAVIPEAHEQHRAKVLETEGDYYVKQPLMKLIKRACLEGGATYDGRRKAVAHHLGITQKIPLPLQPNQSIYAFPTHAPTNFNCYWIFYNHVRRIAPANDTSVITFYNGKQLRVPVSYYILEKQMQRTAYCITRFSGERRGAGVFESKRDGGDD